jgi:hypothetical protein
MKRTLRADNARKMYELEYDPTLTSGMLLICSIFNVGERVSRFVMVLVLIFRDTQVCPLLRALSHQLQCPESKQSERQRPCRQAYHTP